jgi:hypothetical protein
MASGNGFNPMRYDCESQGCFNKKRRPKIELFTEDLPEKIAFTDIDAVCEINGHQLWLEYKSFEGEINRGQHLLFSRQTNYQNKHHMVLVVVADAETMVTESVKTYYCGDVSKFEKCSLIQLKAIIKKWADKAYDLSWQIIK